MTSTRYWFLFHEGTVLLCKQNETCRIPEGDEPPFSIEGSVHNIGLKDGKPCVAAFLASAVEEDEQYVAVGLRESNECLPGEWYRLAGRASELLFWDRTTRFCSACGMATEQNTAISKICPSCHREVFPQVTPAILAMVLRGEEILLVHARNFKGTFKGLVAGFVESGETLEECVQRELHEETSLEVTNIRYFGSQEWPYPNSLMIGFVADYAGGEINFLDEELSSGDFYSKDNLPELPRKLSLARKMIDAWLEGRIS